MLTFLAKLRAVPDRAFVARSGYTALRQVAEAIAHVHSKAVVYRDLNLENVMVAGGTGIAPSKP